VSGMVGSPNCVSESFSFPRTMTNVCASPA
jgi:hypothetical protein